MRYTVDRIEGDFAICEDENRKFTSFKLSALPKGIKEGTIFIKDKKGFRIDNDATRAQEEKIKKLMDSLWE